MMLVLKHLWMEGLEEPGSVKTSQEPTAKQNAPFAAYHCWENTQNPISNSCNLPFLQDPSFPQLLLLF